MSSKSDDRPYEVGYGKPPKATRFGVRPQPERSGRQPSRKEPADIGALFGGSVSVARNGRASKMHPYEAVLFATARQALAGKIRSLRQILKTFRGAGLLEAPMWSQTNSVVTVPKGVPMQLAVRLIQLVGVPPWDAYLSDAFKAEYDADCAHIRKLLREAKENYDGSET
ncbi:MAG: hypothetical protein QOF14_1946 [Hyphomicrobiales bacterium]|nr:hypothetical protein [Hyphomicrobiales bacterium]